MRLTPLDIREQQFRRVMRGLDPEEVETFLATVAAEFETLLGDQKELRQRVVELEDKIGEYRSMEKALRDTLLTAERVMAEAKESAQREAALIIREAEMAAQRATARLSQDLVDLRHQLSELKRTKDTYVARVRWLLRTHLEMIENQAQELADADASARIPAPAPAPPGPRPERPAPDAGPQAPRSHAEPPPQRLPPPSNEGWRSVDVAALGASPPADDLADVLRPISPDGSYGEPPAPYPPPSLGRGSSAEELAQAVRRAERLAAEARAAAERHGAPPAPGVESGWSMDRFREGLGGGSQP